MALSNCNSFSLFKLVKTIHNKSFESFHNQFFVFVWDCSVLKLLLRSCVYPVINYLSLNSLLIYFLNFFSHFADVAKLFQSDKGWGKELLVSIKRCFAFAYYFWAIVVHKPIIENHLKSFYSLIFSSKSQNFSLFHLKLL